MVLIRGRTIHVPSARRYVPGELTGWFADFEPLIRATFLNAHCPGMNVGGASSYSVHAAQRVGSGDTGYAIEPSQENRSRLTKTMAEGLTHVSCVATGEVCFIRLNAKNHKEA